MKKSLRATIVATAAFIPMAFTAGVMPAVASASCDNGWWWDPVANRCQAPVVPKLRERLVGSRRRHLPGADLPDTAGL